MADETMLHGNAWTVTEIAGEPVTVADRPSLQFSSHNRLSGFAGCNRFSGHYAFADQGEPDGGSLSLSQIAATRRMCGEAQMRVERGLFAALGETSDVRTDGGQVLLLRGPDQVPLVRLVIAGR